MVRTLGLVTALVVPMIAAVAARPAGSIRGVVFDKDFDAPLPAAHITIVETGQQITATDEGNFVIPDVAPGTYTLIISKDGYARQIRGDVVVTEGQLTDVNVSLSGDFTEMEEFIVQDLKIGGAEAGLLKLRMESPALIDSISADLMSKAGAGDAASALNLIAGASVQDGKYAVIRGLPDRYVSSQMNGVRLPTADEDKRAVQLDQFPSAVIDNIQVSKTFTPDQQGDASGGAVNVVLKGIPTETFVQFKGQVGYNSQVSGSNSGFLTYNGGGVNTLGRDNGSRDIQEDNIGGNWDGAAGISYSDAPIDYKLSGGVGGKHEFDNGVTIGGFASLYYERDSAFFDNGIDDSLWVVTPGAGLSPETIQGDPSQGDFKTRLFDLTQGSQSVQWGGLGTFGIESENHAINFAYLYTSSTDDTATLAEDTRGKAYFFPGYDPNNPTGPGNTPDSIKAAPYLRTETLQYTELTTSTMQFNGRHALPFGEFGDERFLRFTAPEITWFAAFSDANLNQPDKRQFGEVWLPESFNPGFPPFVPAFTTPAIHLPFKPAANFTLGNFQRIWKEINETSDQYSVNLKLPFEQWSGDEGYFKFGYFDDRVKRTFNQDTFSNFNDNNAQYFGDFDDFWSAAFPSEDHAITASNIDVDYNGDQKIQAWYAMMDLPLTSYLNLIGGARFESTHIGIVNEPEPDATWFPPGSLAPVQLNPGDADVDFNQDNVLPSFGLVLQPIDEITFRASYSQTVARQTFKELTPIIQQEFLGGPIFIGNPELVMSDVTNYDLRLDYTPYDGGLFSVSYFYKEVVNPIEYVQRVTGFTFTTPVNYPKGNLSGFELEARQDMGQVWDRLEGFSLGANATFINSNVTLPDDEAAGFDAPNIQAPMSSRDMTGAPNYLYNLYATYEVPRIGTQLGVFYTMRGDTLVAGAASADGRYVPNIYALPYGTLNLTVTQNIGKNFKIFFQAKNLTNPAIETVYRSEYIDGDTTNTRYTTGIDFAFGFSAQFTF